MVTGIGAVQTAHAASMMASAAGSQIPLKEPVKSDRRSNKPIMEKRRRARINNCLNELKTLILDATKKDPARHSKLEKADILEKTVKYLQDLQRQQAVMSQATDPKVVNKFKAGFTECANEVSRFPGIDPVVKRRLLQHLSNCINGVKTADLHHSAPSPQTVVPSVQVHMLPSPPSSPEQDQQMHSVPNQAAALHPNGYFLSNGLQVIPTKLQNGSYALVVPHSVPQSAQIPTLVPIPSRTSSTSSAASAPCSIYERMTSGSPAAAYTPPSPATSYEMMDCKPSVIQHGSSSSSPHLHYAHVPQSYSPSPAPLSLVIKKERDEDQPWRPW
ncbi:unnamed protein product [Hermetia illucens]|uniref:Hairy n=2 Tax=Hermetia illucens TaxID=343691 RepID=A0A7R8ULR6_HERIL|nr:unnamed protein product [Hermetia illucens]